MLGLLPLLHTPAALLSSLIHCMLPVADKQPPPCSPCCITVGGLFYVYATNSDGRNIQCARSSDLVSWVRLCLIINILHCVLPADAAACGAAGVSWLLHGDESMHCASDCLGLIQSLRLSPAAMHQVVHEEKCCSWCPPPVACHLAAYLVPT